MNTFNIKGDVASTYEVKPPATLQGSHEYLVLSLLKTEGAMGKDQNIGS